MTKPDIYGRVGWNAGVGVGRDNPLRRSVEALGVSWEAYRERRRRGYTHEEALAGPRSRRKRMSDRDVLRGAIERALALLGPLRGTGGDSLDLVVDDLRNALDQTGGR